MGQCLTGKKYTQQKYAKSQRGERMGDRIPGILSSVGACPRRQNQGQFRPRHDASEVCIRYPGRYSDPGCGVLLDMCESRKGDEVSMIGAPKEGNGKMPLNCHEKILTIPSPKSAIPSHRDPLRHERALVRG